MTTKKKIVTILLSVAGVCAVGIGVTFAVKGAQKSEVMVVPVSDLNNGGYWGDSSTMEGMVASDASQNVYLTDTQSVEQVLVKEGDTVREGDVLLTYDMTLTNLNLEMQKLGRDQAELRLQVAQNDLKKLKKTKPVSNQASGGDLPGSGDFGTGDLPGADWGVIEPEPTEPIAPDPTEEPTETPVPTPSYEDAEVFNGTNHPLDYRAFTEQKYYRGAGTKEDPYCFLCQDMTVVQASFLNALMGYTYDESGNMGDRTERGYFFRLEVRKGDKADGPLMKAWLQDGSLIEHPYSGDWAAVLDLSKKEIVTPTPAPDPTSIPDPTSTPESALRMFFGNRRTLTGSADRNGNAALNLTMKGTGKFVFTDTASSTGANRISSGGSSSEMTYTKEELAKAIKDKEAEIKGLELDLREEDIKLRANQKAVEGGQVVAKIDGVVKNVGDPKNPPKDGSPFLVVSGSEGLYVKGIVSELKLDSVKEGDKVDIMSYQSGIMCEATIKDISPYPADNYYDYSNANVSGYPFTAYIASGGDELQNNEYVQITMNQQPGEDEMMQDQDTISLSKAFIREEDGVKYVFLRGEDGRLKRQEIQTGRIFWGDTYEIKSGITSEDWIAFPYGKNVKEGARTKEGTMNQLYGY